MPLNNANWTRVSRQLSNNSLFNVIRLASFQRTAIPKFLKSYLTNRLTVGKAFRHMHPTGRQPSLSIDKHGESSSMFVRF